MESFKSISCVCVKIYTASVFVVFVGFMLVFCPGCFANLTANSEIAVGRFNGCIFHMLSLN